MKVIQSLSDCEAVRVAICMEEDGLKFYTELSRKVKGTKLQGTLCRLATDEKEHVRIFRRLSQSLTTEGQNCSWTGDELVIQYLRELVQPRVFGGVRDVKDTAELARSLKSEADALLIGIQAEKDAILFYNEAYKLSVNEGGKKIFLELAEEEKKHLVTLNQRLEEWSPPIR